MGSGDQCRPLQYCIKIQIQYCPRRGINTRNFANTCHSGHRARPKKSKGAGIIGGHIQSGHDQAKTAGAATAGAPTISIKEQRGERTRRHNHRQRRPSTTKGPAKTKRKRKVTQLPPPPPCPRPNHSPPPLPPREGKGPHPAGHVAEQVGERAKTKGCKYCTKYGRNSLTHIPPNNIPHSK